MSCSASQERHASTVSAILVATPSGENGSGAGPSGGDHCSAKPTRSPAETLKVATIVESSIAVGTPELTTT